MLPCWMHASRCFASRRPCSKAFSESWQHICFCSTVKIKCVLEAAGQHRQGYSTVIGQHIYHEPGKAQLDGLNSAFSLCSFAASMPFSFNMRVSLFGLVWSGLAWRPVQGGPDVLRGQVDSANLAELHIAQEDLLTSLKARLEEPSPQASRAIPAAGLEALQSQVEVVF